MLAHSSCENVDLLDDVTSLVDDQLLKDLPTTSCRKTHTVVKHKHHHTQLPLSKNTCKLTQTGAEMVDAYESALEYSSSTESLHKTSTSNTCSGYFGSDTVTDSEKTPTNFDGNESFKYDADRDETKSNRSTLTDVSQLIMSEHNELQSAKDTDAVLSKSQTIIESESSDELYEDCINEAINFMVNVPDALQTKKVASLQKLCTIKERKRILFHDTLVEDNFVQVEKSEKTKTKQSDRKLSPPPVLVAPDIARLKHRPLSASSISSTTSSSSSGSEHLNSKLSISYLASVESLADHSENELANSNLTLCERACMEIIDSERSYVEDLGQVIKG